MFEHDSLLFTSQLALYFSACSVCSAHSLLLHFLSTLSVLSTSSLLYGPQGLRPGADHACVCVCVTKDLCVDLCPYSPKIGWQFARIVYEHYESVATGISRWPHAKVFILFSNIYLLSSYGLNATLLIVSV